ncbi:MAG: ABC-type transport system, permease component [Chloroflexi bacterium]|jgi:putative ABC transport system permease protein|nr:MAG: ABC-type transport system, permease component [Chloroflexota bacterium]
MLGTTIIMAALAIGDSINKGIRLQVLYSLGETDIRLTSPVFSRFGNNYISDDMLDKVRSHLKDDDRVDGILPLIRENMPVISERTNRTISRAAVVGIALDSLNGFGNGLIQAEDGEELIDITALQDGLTIINRPMANELDVGIGDRITLVSTLGRSEHEIINIAKPVGLIAGTESIRSSALFNVGTLKRILDRQGYRMIEISVKGDYVVEGVTHSEDISKAVANTLKVALVNDDAADTLFRVLKTKEVFEALKSEVSKREADSQRQDNENELSDFLAELGKEMPSDRFIILSTDTATTAVIMGLAEEVEDPVVVQSLLLAVSELVELNVDPIKNRSLEFATLISSAIVVFFTIFGSFSIIVGLLLIFLVFVMLAASRTTEMGIARAIGMKRRHLVQMFTYEGLVYSLGASVVGTGFGLLASMLLIQMMIRAFADSDEVTFFFSVTPRSVVVAFSAGFVLTALTVGVSAFRVSKLNIVVAIRGLSQEFVSEEIPSSWKRTKTVLKWVLGPFTFGYDTWRIWRSGQGIFLRILALLSLFLVVPWIVTLAWKVFKLVQPWLASGWLLLPVGVVLTLGGFDPEKGIEGFAYDNAAMVTIGATVAIISLGLILRRFIAYLGYGEEFQKRVSMTFIGISLLTFFGLPFDALDGLTGELEGGPELFILGGVSLVAAAVWIVMHNADVLVWIVSKTIGRWGSLRPVIKMAIAYPMSARLRTGLTLAMFSLVIFTMMIFAILTNLGDVVGDNPDMASGGFDIRGTIKAELPIDDPWAVIESRGKSLSVSDFEVITAQARLPVEVRQDDAGSPVYKRARIRASDEAWITNNRYQLTHWDPLYGSTSTEIWALLAADPKLAIVGAEVIGATDNFGPQPEGNSVFRIEGIKPGERGEIGGVDITMRPPIGQGLQGALVKRKVIGVLDQFADSLENPGTDIYMHYSVLGDLSDKPVPFVEYKFRLTDPLRAGEITRLLETTFIENGMRAHSINEVIAENRAQGDAFNQLFQGFMGLGLLVGVAALGVVAFRAVVERRQSVGMLRAIGYKARMVQLQLLMESGFVAVLGSLLGVGLGTLIAWNIFKSISKESPGMTFSVPASNIIVIILITLMFSLLNTLLPAWQASKITPSEALRYE